MPPLVSLVAIAAAAGIAVALQGHVMGAMDRAAGTSTSVFVTYGGGALIAAALWLSQAPSLATLRRVPWYSWSAGLLGLVIVGGIGYTAPRLGLGRTLVITVAAQLIAAILLERTFDVRRLAGIAVVVLGVWLVVSEK